MILYWMRSSILSQCTFVFEVSVGKVPSSNLEYKREVAITGAVLRSRHWIEMKSV